jgi:hypothetical protein
MSGGRRVGRGRCDALFPAEGEWDLGFFLWSARFLL